MRNWLAVRSRPERKALGNREDQRQGPAEDSWSQETRKAVGGLGAGSRGQCWAFPPCSSSGFKGWSHAWHTQPPCRRTSCCAQSHERQRNEKEGPISPLLGQRDSIRTLPPQRAAHSPGPERVKSCGWNQHRIPPSSSVHQVRTAQ